MNKIYIITGANGFLGNNIIRKLEQEKNKRLKHEVEKKFVENIEI